MTVPLGTKFKNVMIVDDNNMDLYISQRNIIKSLFGEHVLQYSSGVEALKFLQDNEQNIEALPQVIFVDIYMPLMSGFEFMEGYDKLSPALKGQCKAFIVSSSMDQQDISRAKSDRNVVAFCEKPLTREVLEGIC